MNVTYGAAEGALERARMDGTCLSMWYIRTRRACHSLPLCPKAAPRPAASLSTRPYGIGKREGPSKRQVNFCKRNLYFLPVEDSFLPRCLPFIPRCLPFIPICLPSFFAKMPSFFANMACQYWPSSQCAIESIVTSMHIRLTL
ncbi:hypothetical protein TIFTF001_010762 [Ficus carica]|uniref:Uncharacterized protein n=1 Tax=Ficus carica TaxID=3494 RepID=A0AA88D058_FICCA|nr:hypothetical protein TIFTF001_010762 [Ficus carica]